MKESLRKTQQRQWGRKWKELARGKGQCVFISLAESGLPCGTQDPRWCPWAVMCGLQGAWTQELWYLSSLTRDRTRFPCIRRQILNHWTTREIPKRKHSKVSEWEQKDNLLSSPLSHRVEQQGWKRQSWLSLKQKWIFCKINETEASGPSIHRLLPEPLQ